MEWWTAKRGPPKENINIDRKKKAGSFLFFFKNFNYYVIIEESRFLEPLKKASVLVREIGINNSKGNDFLFELLKLRV